MIRSLIGSMLVLGVVVSTAAAQESLPTPSRTTGTAIAPRTNLILNESSPSDWLSSEGINNPRSRQQADSQPITRLPVSASVSLDDEQHMERYQREYDARRWSMQQAQREREMRQMRLELKKFYGISSARPVDSTAMGIFYSPNPMGWYGYQYPNQRLHFQVR